MRLKAVMLFVTFPVKHDHCCHYCDLNGLQFPRCFHVHCLKGGRKGTVFPVLQVSKGGEGQEISRGSLSSQLLPACT